MGNTAKYGYWLIVASFLFVAVSSTQAQDQTVGLFTYDTAIYRGYTLFAPMSSSATVLMDDFGRMVHSWEAVNAPAASVYLLDNGNLLRTNHLTGSAGAGGGVQIFDWDGNVVWDYVYWSDTYLQHHDIEPMPNGNVLILAWEYKTVAEAVAAGRNPALLDDTLLWPEHIVEVKPTGPTTGEIVWEWHLWDHLIQDFDPLADNYGVVEDHPELMDLNYAPTGNPDWIHANAIDYNAELDQIVISARTMNELWIIDHGTTTEEAAGNTGGRSGMGGAFLYRWGNPLVYRAGTAADQKLFGQHDVHWIPEGLPGAGNLLVYNNGQGRTEGNYSTVDEIVPAVGVGGRYARPASGEPFGPASAIWSYVADPPTSFYSNILSSAQRLPNGNTLICAGRIGKFTEIDENGQILWEYINPITATGGMNQGDVVQPGSNFVFRALRFTSDFPGLAGRTLIPETTLERYPITVSGTSHSPVNPESNNQVEVTTSITYDYQPAVVELKVGSGNDFWTIPMDADGVGEDGDFLYSAVVPAQAGPDVFYYIYVEASPDTSLYDPPNAPFIAYNYSVEGGLPYVCGDASGDGTVDVGDAVFLINYIFKSGAAPDPIEAGDANCDNQVNVGDAVYLIQHIFNSGPQPCCQF